MKFLQTSLLNFLKYFQKCETKNLLFAKDSFNQQRKLICFKEGGERSILMFEVIPCIVIAELSLMMFIQRTSVVYN